MTGPFRRAAFSALMVALLSVMASSPVAAGTVKLRVNVQIGDFCLSGSGVPKAVHVVSLRAPDGELRGRFREDATRRGRWFGCFGSDPGPRATINAGDAIKIRVEGRKRTFTVPDIRPRIDRVGDVIRGRGPAGATIQVRVERVEATGTELGIAREATVDARGRWRLDLAGEYDIVGGWRVSVRLDDDGMLVLADSGVPFVALSVAAAAVSGSANPGQTVHLRLVDSDGATRAEVSTRAFYRDIFIVSLQDHRGNAVYPAQVIASSRTSPLMGICSSPMVSSRQTRRSRASRPAACPTLSSDSRPSAAGITSSWVRLGTTGLSAGRRTSSQETASS